MEQVREALTCGICMDLVNLPVHGTCCENAKSSTPACLSCVRSYLKLNDKQRNRPSQCKSWAGCGCTIQPQVVGSSAYFHAKQLDMIRNAIGPSYCHHEDCTASFSTCAELRRHLTGTSTPSDTHGNCKEAMMRCPHENCHFFGKRKVVEGQHYRDFHCKVFCHICKLYVLRPSFAKHVKDHEDEARDFEKKLLLLRESIEEIERNTR